MTTTIVTPLVTERDRGPYLTNPTTVAELVHKLGRGERYFAAHGGEMTSEQREAYRRKLADLHPQVDAALAKTGTRLADHGWTTTRGIWHVVGEAPATRALTDAECVVQSTFRQVCEILADVPEADQAGARRTKLEGDLNAAAAREDLASVTQAASAYLDWAQDLKGEQP